MIKFFEGFHAEPYDDGTGVITQGYGAVYRVDGTKVRADDPPVTKQQAEEELVATLDEQIFSLQDCAPLLFDRPDREVGALLSFDYNIPLFSKNTDKIDACLVEQRWDDIPALFPLYRNKNTDLELGLLRRRVAEMLVWGGATPDAAIAQVQDKTIPELLEISGG